MYTLKLRFTLIYSKSYLVLLYHVSILCKGECDRLESSRLEMVLKLKELAAHCEEVERQRDKEADNCRLLKVLPLYLGVYSDLGLCWSSVSPNAG